TYIHIMINATQLKTYNTDTFDFNDFEYIPEDYEDTEGTSLAVESESVMTDNVMADKSDFDIELKTFLFNDTSFNQARKLAEAEEETDINILQENNDTDIDIESCNIASSLAADLESENNENEYLVQGNIDTNMKLSQRLSACPILDIVDGDIKCCGSYSQAQRSLTQLVGAWEIDSEIFQQTKATNNLSMMGVYLHKNDTTDGLQILGHWIMRMAETADEGKKKVLLTYLISVLPAFFDTKSFPVTTKSPSLLFVKIVLRLGHVNMMNIIDQKYDITSETAPALGKALGIATWNARYEVRNKKMNLESPSSLAVYQDGFPLCLKLYISSAQAERERLELLISEYMGDMVTIKEERAVLSRKEALWKLANELFVALSLPDPKTHEIFMNAPEMTPTGFSNIFACYDLGTARLYEILRQDVYKIEPKNTVGRRKRNVVVHNIHINQAENSNVAAGQLHEQMGAKRQRRATSNYEKNILDELLKYDTFPEEKAVEILRNIQEQSNDWDMQRVRIYWNNNRHNKRKKVSSDM
ncbi:14776_t:CDS:2, partial [Gigaspora margarita]